MRILVSAFIALLAIPAAADAATWRGKTRQGERVSVRTGADGVVNRVRIGFRAGCDDGKGFERGVVWLPPFDAPGATAFQDEGVIKWTFTKSRERARGRTSISRRASPTGSSRMCSCCTTCRSWPINPISPA